MVRLGTLPLRLLALKYGADFVYSPEIIDKRLIDSERILNETLGTIDFVDSTGKLNLRIHPMESSKLIVQIGSADPNLALLAALKVSKDVYGIDLNCGCPKRFSLQGGMGAALLENQDLLFTILETLVANLDIPVSCKIRLLYPDGTSSSVERTVKLLKRLEQTKVSAIGVHCRFTDQRPREKAHWDILEQLAGSVKIPIFANGDFYTLDNVHEFEKRVDGKINSFLIARGAQDNVSCFCRDGPLPYRTVMREYLTLAMEYDMPFANAKYALLQMGYDESERVQFKKELTQCKSFNDAW